MLQAMGSQRVRRNLATERRQHMVQLDPQITVFLCVPRVCPKDD